MPDTDKTIYPPKLDVHRAQNSLARAEMQLDGAVSYLIRRPGNRDVLRVLHSTCFQLRQLQSSLATALRDIPDVGETHD